MPRDPGRGHPRGLPALRAEVGESIDGDELGKRNMTARPCAGASSTARRTSPCVPSNTSAGGAVQIRAGEHPVVPIMPGDAHLAHQMAADLLGAGIYVVGASYPVVPKEQARIRVQISAAHEPDHLEHAVAAFVAVARAHGVIPGESTR